MAPHSDTFERLIDPLFKFVNETPDRVPFSDFYWTDSGKHAGMHARPVIGGVFIRMLADRATWLHCRAQARELGNDWAPFPAAPKFVTVVPAATEAASTWRFTTEHPVDAEDPAFDDHEWKAGPGGFGTPGTPGAEVRTCWDSPDIWLRRTVRAGVGPDPRTGCGSIMTRMPRSTSTASSPRGRRATPAITR